MKTFVIILILAVIVIGGYMLWGRSDTVSTSTPPAATTTDSGDSSPSTNPEQAPGDIATMFTREEVTKHDNSKDCWAIVGTSVYNLTSWISKHPGGQEAILGICGKDATTAFENQHGGQSKPESTLSTFFIGTLKI